MGSLENWKPRPRILIHFVLQLLWLLLLQHVAQCEEIVAQSENIMGGGYKMTSISKLLDGTGIVAHLTLIQPGTDLYGPDIRELRVVARYEGDSVHVHITDANSPRWEVPQSVIPRPNVTSLQTSPPTTDHWDTIGTHPTMLLKYTVDPFGFSVTRRANNEVLFNTSGFMNSLVFKDQYLEISSHLPKTAYLYGLGEVSRPDGLRLLPNKTYTLWATDIASYFFDIPLYSSYPFIMDMREGENSAHGVLLLNSNGMDILYEENFITYKLIGGVFDFYFFPGGSPLNVIDQLTELVGRPAAMPYWSLGFHQARFGYKNVEELEHVTREYAAANLPMESISADIDYMENFLDFTLNPETYPEEKLRPFVDRLHAHHQKFIMILDPNVKIDETYKTYVRGSALDVFLRNGSAPEIRYVAQVWPGACNIPDFLHPNAQQWWTEEIRDFHAVIPFDGLWLDMNEPANFCSGPNCYYEQNAVCPEIIWKCCMKCNMAPMNRWDDPPYMINNFGNKRPLYVKTVSLNTLHHDGSKMYDTHNIYGTTEAMVTHKALADVTNTRPFVLSRSCFFGAGSVAAHWTGDNGALWSELQGSIVSIMSSGMFGMPMVGADICGFNMDTTEELCRRWVQVGAFYPFTRSHSDSAATNQELFLWKSVTQAGAKVLHWRYRLLPFWYTLMHTAHTTGAPYMRPLFFTFPEDKQTWTINHQFTLGDAILVSPVLHENTTSVTAYFPRGVWYDLFGVTSPIQASERGIWETLPTPMDAINVHIRGGRIIPLQEFAMTTTEARATPFTLLIAFEREANSVLASSVVEFNDREYAFGQLYMDDDAQVAMTLAAGRASFVTFEATRIGSSYRLKSFVNESEFAMNGGFVVDTIKVFGMQFAPQVVHVNGEVANVEVTVDAVSHSVEISGLRHPLGMEMEVVWSSALHRYYLPSTCGSTPHCPLPKCFSAAPWKVPIAPRERSSRPRHFCSRMSPPCLRPC